MRRLADIQGTDYRMSFQKLKYLRAIQQKKKKRRAENYQQIDGDQQEIKRQQLKEELCRG